jgi:KEOPS complex subunit Cgi121
LGRPETLGELGRHVSQRLLIKGFRKVKLSALESFLPRLRETVGGAKVQLFDADRIGGRRHLEAAVLNAVRAFQDGYNISRSFPVEVMVYASAQRQIGKAFQLVGLRPETENVAVLIFEAKKSEAENLLKRLHELMGGKMDDRVVSTPKGKHLKVFKRIFNISDREIEAVKTRGESEGEAAVKIALEKVSLLSAGR